MARAQHPEGRLEQAGGRWQLVFTRQLPHSPDTVWRAITEPDHLAVWFPTTIEGERAAGAPLRFAFPGGEAPAEDGEMLAYEPPSLLEFRWGESGIIRIELRADAGGTQLTFTNRFEELGKAARDGAGWHVCLDNLARHLDGEAPDLGPDAWRRAHAAYVERFGYEASTIGPPEGHPLA